MAGMEAGDKRVMIGTSVARASFANVGRLVALAMLVLAVAPAIASAEPLCTDSWVGPTEGSWQTAENWSSGGVPTTSDVACVGSGKKVVSTGVDSAGVLIDEGTLVVGNGTLELSGLLMEPSVVHSLTLSGGTLTGAATLEVSSVFSWSAASTMAGSGATVLRSSSSNVIEPLSFETKVTLTERRLVNEGSTTFVNGQIAMGSGATLENSGTFRANSQEGSDQFLVKSGGSAPKIINSGMFEKASGSGTTASEVGFENSGTIDAKVGVLAFGSGSSLSIADGSTLEGSVGIQGATATAGTFSATGTLTVGFGSFSVSSGKIATLKGLTVGGGTIGGAGTVKVTSSLKWTNESTMAGTGSTVVTSAATGTIEFPELERTFFLNGRTFVNEGTVTIGSKATLSMGEGAVLTNKGVLVANADKIDHGSGSTPELVNSGTIEKTGGRAEPTKINVPTRNEGVVNATTKQLEFEDGGSSVSAEWLATGGGRITLAKTSYSFKNGVWAGRITIGSSATVTAEEVSGTAANVEVGSGTFTVTGNMTLAELGINSGTLTGSGTVRVSKSMSWNNESTMSGSGSTVIESGATATISDPGIGRTFFLAKRALLNEGSTTVGTEATLSESEGARLTNNGTVIYNGPSLKVGSGAAPIVVNHGTFEKTQSPPSESIIEPNFENYGTVAQLEGKLLIQHPIEPEITTQLGELNPSMLKELRSLCGKPVDCVTGNETETQTDLAIDGRGLGLTLTRTYNAQAAATASSAGMFGYGWTSTYSDHLVVESANHRATVYQANGSTVPFTEEGGSFVAPVWSADTLTGSSETGYVLTLPDQIKYAFNGSNGRLESETDRNGNQTTLSYNEKAQLATITDPAGRKIKLVYNIGGQVETAEDPMGHIVKYAYESGNLTSVTLPGETNPNWRFKYDSSHRMTLMMNGLGGETANAYDTSNRVTSQKDPLGHVLKFEYEAFQTKITNEATGAVTVEQFNSNDMVTAITHGYGTAAATTTKLVYNERNEPTAITDGNGHTTNYEYNASGDRTKLTTPEGHETKWTYNATHDVLTVTTPSGEETKITHDEHGNPTVITRPAPKETTQEVKFEYNAHGQPTSMTDPLARKWTYGYDTNGDRTSETDPEGDKRTWTYNEDSQQTSTVSPRGNIEGGEPAKYTTSMERDAQGRTIKVTDPLGHETHYGYDPDSNQTSTKDANGHESKTTFNLANEPTKVTEPNGAIVETEYDGAGQVTAQIDGNKHTTKYVRNVLEQVTEIIDPLLRKTTKTYDLAGNLATIKDAAKRTTTYTHNKDNQLTKIAYSDGVTPTVEYEYDANGNRTNMTDGTGKTTYTYDQLDRLTKTKDGHGNLVSYEYDLANQQTKITYPNGKTVERSYDKAGRLHSVTDWLEHTTSFAYDQNSNLTATTYPTGTSEQDTYGYNQADQQTEAKMSKGEEVLASLTYTHDSNGQVTTTVAKGLPGAETTEYSYDENERLTKANTNKYEYDAANNPMTTPGSTNTFDAADELTESTSTKYSYGEVGERTKATPTSGPATTYDYNQAGDLTSVSRPEEGETSKIEDSYAYNGDGMRVSQTVNGKTNHLTLDASEGLPLTLNDDTNSYIYGPAGLPVEQINTEGKVLFLHHDQQGSTRMLTGTSGTVEATMSFDPYGNTTGSTGTAITPLEYDGQYTNADTGLIDLRARSYDPRTTQFMSEDPATGLTLEPYSYANDNPLNLSDPSGLLFGIPGTPSTSEVAGSIAKGAESVANGTGEALNTAGKAVNSVAHVAAPVIDGVAAGVCVAAAEACGTVLIINFALQQILAADQALYNPNYNFGLNEAAIIAGTGLGALGAGAVDLAKLRLIGRLVLGGSIAAPQWLLNIFQLLSPEEAAALLGCE